GICRQKFNILTEITEIPFFDSPDCQLERTKSGAVRSEKVTLKFSTDCPPEENGNLAFVVRDQLDRVFLIGSKETPKAVMNVTVSTGTPSGSPAAAEIEITHTAIKTLVECEIF
ncbi:MAG: hypothetical protein J1E97_08715, partial [Muribaculaceae bacterium]|nr:hypothetical protein [Muribaculaceae bacterium]